MATAQNVFPKSGGDPLYNTEINKFQEKFKAEVNKIGEHSPYRPVMNYNYSNNSIIAVGQEFGSGLNARNYYSVTDGMYLNTTPTVVETTLTLPRIIGSDTGSQFISDTFYSSGTPTTADVYVNYQPWTLYDECDNSSVDDSLWSSGGTIRENGSMLSFSGTSYIQTANILPFGVTEIQLTGQWNADDGNQVRSAVEIVGSNVGSVQVIDIFERTGQSEANSFIGQINLYIPEDKQNIYSLARGRFAGTNEANREIEVFKKTVLPSTYGGSNYLKISADQIQAAVRLQSVRWLDRNATYTSTGSIYISNDGGNNFTKLANGQSSVLIAGSKWQVRADYGVTGSEVIVQKSWGLRLYD